MKQLIIFFLAIFMSSLLFSQGENEDPAFATSTDLKITNTSTVFDDRLEQLIFTIEVEGNAGKYF